MTRTKIATIATTPALPPPSPLSAIGLPAPFSLPDFSTALPSRAFFSRSVAAFLMGYDTSSGKSDAINLSPKRGNVRNGTVIEYSMAPLLEKLWKGLCSMKTKMRFTILCAVSAFSLLTSIAVIGQTQLQPYRLTDREVQSILRGVESQADTFRKDLRTA